MVGLARGTALALVIVVADQASKYLVGSGPGVSYGSIQVGLTYNHGWAFSLPLPFAAILGFQVAWVALLAVLTFARQSTAAGPGLLLITAGGVSNLVDRAVHGAVRDSISVGTIFLNLADLAVLLGAAVVITGLLLPKHYSRVFSLLGNDIRLT